MLCPGENTTTTTKQKKKTGWLVALVKTTEESDTLWNVTASFLSFFSKCCILPEETTTYWQYRMVLKEQVSWPEHSSLISPLWPSPCASFTSVQVSKILKETKRRNTRRNICFLSRQISLNSCTEFEPMTGSPNQIMCETDAEATRSCSLRTLFVLLSLSKRL